MADKKNDPKPQPEPKKDTRYGSDEAKPYKGGDKGKK